VKIIDVEVIPLSYATDDVPRTRRSFAVLKIVTDDGIVGWGEASDCYGHRHPLAVRALVDEDLKYALLGQDPADVVELIARLRNRVLATLGSRELGIQVLSAIDIALWDARGKADGVSIGHWFPRIHDRVPVYAAGKPALSHDAEWHLEFLKPVLDRGATAAKIRPGRGLEWDTAFVRDFRQRVGDDLTLFVDGKYNYFPETALDLSRVLADIGVHCFEEPISDVDIEAVAQLAAESSVPLAYGEHGFGVVGFRELIEHGVAVLEPDVTVCGGIHEAVAIAELVETSGRELMPHIGGLTAIGLAANIHVAAAREGTVLVEYDARAHQPLRDELPGDSLFGVDRIVDGTLAVPEGPGLGISVDEAVFERFPYSVDADLLSVHRSYGTPHL
jgi:L-alanine-DL-glutamate epimerase-like enolase superfamily enzyme